MRVREISDDFFIGSYYIKIFYAKGMAWKII